MAKEKSMRYLPGEIVIVVDPYTGGGSALSRVPYGTLVRITKVMPPYYDLETVSSRDKGKYPEGFFFWAYEHGVAGAGSLARASVRKRGFARMKGFNVGDYVICIAPQKDPLLARQLEYRKVYCIVAQYCTSFIIVRGADGIPFPYRKLCFQPLSGLAKAVYGI